MIFPIIIAFAALMALVVLHELGHFLLAKKFGVQVDEFGIGYPPRLFGKKIKGTIYSINLLPFGAFIRIPDDQDKPNDPKGFNNKPFWQKFIIIFGGVLSFWIIAVILLSVEMGLGVPTMIEDSEISNLINPKVQIIAVAPSSPAAQSKLAIGDTIKKLSASDSELSVSKVQETQDFINLHKGQEITLTIERGKETLVISLVPRASPPSGEGPLGVALARTALQSYPWYRAPIEGVKATGYLTLATIEGWGQALDSLIHKKPTGVQLMGPVGVVDLFAKVSQLGINYFLQFVAIIAVYMALFNILPIPMVDGGRILFLVIGKVRGRDISPKVARIIDSAFFILLLSLMVVVTIKDIARLF